MQINSTSKSGAFNPRFLLGLCLCLVGVLLAMISFATPTPTSGTLKSTNIGSANAINYTDSVGAPVTYTINAVNTTGGPEPYAGTVYLQPIPTTTTCPTCPVPRYQTYYVPDGLTPNGAGEPSIGVDWNPNVASLKVTAPATLAHGPTLLNTGGVTFFQAQFNTLQVGFDDCASPALNTW